MSYRRDCGNSGCKKRPRHDLFIKRPEIFQRSAASTYHQYVEWQDLLSVQPVSEMNGLCNLERGPVSLNSNGEHINFAVGAPSVKHGKNVLQRRTGSGRNDSNMLGGRRNRLLGFGSEESFLSQPGFELFKGELQRAGPGGLHVFADELKFAPALI